MEPIVYLSLLITSIHNIKKLNKNVNKVIK